MWTWGSSECDQIIVLGFQIFLSFPSLIFRFPVWHLVDNDAPFLAFGDMTRFFWRASCKDPRKCFFVLGGCALMSGRTRGENRQKHKFA